MNKSGYGSDIEDQMAILVGQIAAVCLVIAIYLAFKAVNLIVRVLVKYPHEKILWWLLGGALGFSTLAGAAFRWPTIAAVMGALATFCWVALLMASMVVEERRNQLFHREHVNTIHQALKEPWWQWQPA